ncbi:MAG: hypothetical protein ACO38W_08635 [Phycisphaerales bacterium]
MSPNDQIGLGVAVILWRRRWLVILAATLMLAALLPWALQRESAREALVRIPRINRSPVASAAEITAEVRLVIAPAVGCLPNEAAAFGVEEAGGIVRLTQPFAPDDEWWVIAALDKRLVAVAAGLDAALATRLAAEVERIDVEIAAFEAQLESLRSTNAEFVESAGAAADYAKLAGSRASAEPGAVISEVREARASGRLSRILAVAAISTLGGVLVGLGLDMLLAARSIARSAKPS